MKSTIYYNNSKTLYIKKDVNEELTDIPEETQNIIFDSDSSYNQPIDNLPKNIKYLNFGFLFTKPVDNLPISLTHLTLSECFNRNVDFLPKNLTHLTFGMNFNKKVDYLPQTLTYLILGGAFNQKVDFLPKNLIHIKFINEFNKPVKNLPKNLTHLSFGGFFAQSIENLPKNITHLEVGYYFSHSVLHLQNLTSLKYYNYRQPNRSIPYTIKKLYIYSYDLNHELPNFIDKLYILFSYGSNYDTNMKKMLENYTNLKQLSFIIHSFTNDYSYIIDNLPNNLTHLIFSKTIPDIPLINLPENLKHIQLGWNITNIIIPKNVKSLCLCSDSYLLNNIPEHIEKIHIYFNENNKKVENLPLTIKEIVIEEEYFSEYIKIPYGCVLTIKKFE